jgi:hypothetical protein
MKRKGRNKNNANVTKVVKASGREVIIPRLTNTGMTCQIRGIPNYMKIAKARFDDKNIVSVFLRYHIPSGQYGITKSIDAIVKSMTVPLHSSRITPTNQPHFIMATASDDRTGHAVSILVDPPHKVMWVFDPLGEVSEMNPYGRAIVQNVVPILQGMWTIPGSGVRMYKGPNLQALNTHTIGVCTSFYISFMDWVETLLRNPNMHINIIGKYASMTTQEQRVAFMHTTPNINTRIVTRNVRLKGSRPQTRL